MNGMQYRRCSFSKCSPLIHKSLITKPSPQCKRFISPHATDTKLVEAPPATTENQQLTSPSINNKITQDDWDSFTSAYTSQYTEHAFHIDPTMIEGEIPKDLRGTFIRNGPGIFEIGGQRVNQPFDGDGMLASFAFPGDGEAPFFCNRLVRTEAFVAEQQANKMLYRGAFSVGNPSGTGFYNPFDFSIKKVANTAVVHWARRTLALYERDLPYEVSSPDLRTVGPTDLNGAIDRPYFAAHHRIITHYDPENNTKSKRLIGFCSEEHGLMDNLVTVWEFDEQGNQLHKTSVVLPNAAFAFLHDMIVTEKHYIFIENPVRMDVGKLLSKYMFGKACIAECLKYDPEQCATKIHVIARPTNNNNNNTIATSPVFHHRTFTSPVPFFSFHHANAYESPTNDGRIIIDTVALLDGFDFSANLEVGAKYYDSNVGRGTLTRLVITPWENDADKIVTHQVLMDRACEFPSVAQAVVGRKHQHVYMVGARFDDENAWGPPEVVVKATTVDNNDNKKVEQKVFHPGTNKWSGEPLFVPRSTTTDEDDGYVLVVVFDATNKSSELVILNAKDMNKIATVKLGDVFLPAGLHGTWTQDYLGPIVSDSNSGSSSSDKYRNGGVKYDVKRGGPLKYE